MGFLASCACPRRLGVPRNVPPWSCRTLLAGRPTAKALDLEVPAQLLATVDKRKGSNGGGLQMIDLNIPRTILCSLSTPTACVACTICGCSWPMKADRSIVRRLRNDAPTCWKMPNFAELSDRISVQAKLGASLRGFPIGMTCGG